MADRLREIGDFKGVGHFEAEFQVAFRANIYGPLDNKEWLYYNFAAGSFHTKKLRSRLHWIEIELY